MTTAPILITGGSGFIGSHVIRNLVERGESVVNFDTRPPANENAWWLRNVLDRVQFVQGSIDDWSSVVAAVHQHRPRSILHIATITNPVLLAQRPSLSFDVNLRGAFNFLEAARLFAVQRFVYISSIGVLPSVQYQPIDANHPILLATEGPGSSFYGAAKVAGEAYCWAYRQSFGLDFIIIRPSAVYGFGQQWPIFIKPMVENAVLGKATHFEKGREFPRDYTHVADVAQLMIQALDIPADKVQDRVFYAATGQPLVTAGQVAEIVKELVPGAQLAIGSGLSENDLLEIRYRGVLEIKNAQQQLGYQPKFANVRDGIIDYIVNLRSYLAER